jgi:hypothetical protein
LKRLNFALGAPEGSTPTSPTKPSSAPLYSPHSDFHRRANGTVHINLKFK